ATARERIATAPATAAGTGSAAGTRSGFALTSAWTRLAFAAATGTIAARTVASAWTIAAARTVASTWTIAATCTLRAASPASRPISRGAARSKRGLTIVAAEIHAVVRAATDVVALVEFVGDVLIVVPDTVPVIDVVIPIVATVVDVDRSVDVDVVAAPIYAAAPIVSTGSPASNGITCAECQSGCKKCAATWPIACAPVVWRIGGVGPCAIDDRRIVVRNVNRLRIGRLDHDVLLATLTFLRDFLLRRRFELVVCIGLGAQPLDRVHHIGLLREHCITELL